MGWMLCTCCCPTEGIVLEGGRSFCTGHLRRSASFKCSHPPPTIPPARENLIQLLLHTQISAQTTTKNFYTEHIVLISYKNSTAYTISKCLAIIRKSRHHAILHDCPPRLQAQTSILIYTIAISSCAASKLASLSAASATNAMANARSATPTSAPRHWPVSATSVLSETTRTSALFAAERVSRTRSIASNVRAWRRTETGARRSSI